jgi:CheY-like chemotaxis protein
METAMDYFTRTVLVVENEPLIRMMLVEALEGDGYAVREAGTVLPAIAVLGHANINAVITDIDMPGGLTGLDLAQLLQFYDKVTPTMVPSGGHPLKAGTLPGRARFIAEAL